MSGERTEGSPPSRLRWYVGVPLGTNPLILLDLSILLTIGWSVSWLSLLALQAGFGGYVDASHVKGAALVSGYLVLAFLGLFGVVCFVVMRNRYAALYRFDEEDAFCDNMRSNPRAADGRRLHFTGYPIDPILEVIRSTERRARWEDVTTVQPMDAMRVLLLRGRRGVLMRVYCPDDATYDQALLYAETHRKKTDASSR